MKQLSKNNRIATEKAQPTHDEPIYVEHDEA